MLRVCFILLSVLCWQLLAGCSTDHLARGLYDGIRVHNDLNSPPSERLGKQEAPDYRDYERMRKERL